MVIYVRTPCTSVIKIKNLIKGFNIEGAQRNRAFYFLIFLLKTNLQLSLANAKQTFVIQQSVRPVSPL